MKKLLLSCFLIISNTAFSQEIKESYDKFKGVSGVALRSYIDLQVNREVLTSDFEINIERVSDKKDTVYFFMVVAESLYDSWCGKGLQAIILADSNRIDLVSAGGDFKPDDIFWKYWVWYEIDKEDILKLYYAKNVDIKCYLREGSLEAGFRIEDKSTLNGYLKNVLFKNTLK